MMHRSVVLFVLFLVLIALRLHAGDELLFRDSFENVSADCIAGLAPDAAVGPAPAGAYMSLGCLEFRNGAPEARNGEIARGGIPLAETRQLSEADFDRLVLVGPGEVRVPAQFAVISRWGGPLADTARPVRWLEVIAPVDVAAADRAAYALRLYDAPVAALDTLDPMAVAMTADGNGWQVDTGLATFRLDPANPALIDWIDADPDADGSGPRTRIYTDQPGAGPRLAPAGGSTLSTATPGTVSVDAGGFSIEQVGPVSVRVVLRGHFSDPSGDSLCTDAGVTPYEAFGYTATATFHRASRDIELEWIVRNECSDAFSAPWTDQAVDWAAAEWRWPLSLSNPAPLMAASGGVVLPAGTDMVVEQRKGAFDGGDWGRRAEARVDSSLTDSASAFDRPLVGSAGDDFLAVLEMPWMRYREPQALRATGGELGALPVSRTLTVGEGKGLWSRLLLQIHPRAGDVASQAEALRVAGRHRLEAPLIPRRELAALNATGIFPDFGSDADSPVHEAYERYMNTRHANTVRDDATGQWARAKTYGSQLWPDTQFNDLFVFPAPLADEPANNSGAMNYWNPSGAEMLEFLRDGDPKWVWDFAQPQAWLQLFSARMNIGARNHGARNGVAVTSGGTGEGQWHRSGGGSDDYTYNAGMHLHYALRPTPAMRARFRHGGRMVLDRYSVPWNPNDPGDTSDPNQLATQTDRDLFFNGILPLRGSFQHFELLANCAEFVPGPDGAACDARLHEILAELANDNLRAGLLCMDDVPVDDFCDLPQTFMTNAMMYHFLLRYYLNYGDVDDLSGQPSLSRMLAGLMPVFYAQGMTPRAQGGPDAFGDWAYALGCQLTGGGTTVGTCTWFDTGDGLAMYVANKAHTVALGLISHAVDPAAGLCATSRRLLDELFANLDPVTNPFGPLDGFADAGGGWWKGANQAAQMLVFAVGGYEACTANP